MGEADDLDLGQLVREIGGDRWRISPKGQLYLLCLQVQKGEIAPTAVWDLLREYVIAVLRRDEQEGAPCLVLADGGYCLGAQKAAPADA